MAVPDRAPAEAVAPPAAADPGADAGRGIALLEPVPPVAMVIAAAMSIQFGAALGATLFDDVGPAGASLLRLLFAAVILVALWRPRVRAYDRGALRLALGFGLALGLMNLSFYEALDRIPLGVAVTIEFIGPVTVAVIFSRRALDLVWILLAVAGIVLLADPFGAGGVDRLGLAFVLLAALCWGIYIVLAQRASRVFSGSTGLAIGAAVAALVPLGPGLVEGGSGLLAPEALAIGLAVALGSSVIPYSLEMESLRRIPANVFGVLMSLEPAVAAMAGFVVLGQRLGAREIVAIALVVAASVGVTRTKAPPPVEA
ncbi:MAG: inner rane transporter RhtA [Solirubrobacteraceae bacterium]|jgi:inner membrane transporter RhtA|nr:inner rane transporter RhtA [Solirubrobacteraceae bacterium]